MFRKYKVELGGNKNNGSFSTKTVLLALLLGDQDVVKLRFVTHTHAHTIYQR